MRRQASNTRARCARSSCVSANTMTCACTACSKVSICSITVPINECSSMTITVREISDSEQWNSFLTSQPRGHLLQSYQWGELNRYLGGRIYRLGALEDERVVGALLLSVAQVPLPVSLPGIHLNWLY